VYTLIRRDDGSLAYRTRVAPENMTPDEACRALSGLVPLLQDLLDAGYPGGRPGSEGPDGDAMIIPSPESLAETHRVSPPEGREDGG
jgi:hypothetical protein